MLKLEGKIFRANLMIRQAVVENDTHEESFVRELEICLVCLCRTLEVPIPLWLSKNTHEFAAFHQTIFFSDQFTEEVSFDRFQIRMI